MSEPERPSHILLVDDEEAITANLAPFLERVGFKVSIASVRGFGKVWSSAPNVRSSLSQALAPEQGSESPVQDGWIHYCSRLGDVRRPIYLCNVEGRVIRLWPGEVLSGQWQFIAP